MESKKQYERVGIVGWNGMSNVGDDAMLQVIVNHLVLNNGTKKFKIWGQADSFPKLNLGEQYEIDGFNHYKHVIAIKGLRKYLLKWFYDEKFSKDLDLLLFGGGSIFHSFQNAKHFYNIVYSARNQNTNVRIGAIGVSLGPFSNVRAKDEYKVLFSNFDFITLRDEASKEIYESMNLSTPSVLAPDLALGLANRKVNSGAERARQEIVYGVSLRFGAVNKKLRAKLAILIQSLIESNEKCKIVFFIFSGWKKESDLDEVTKLLGLVPDFIQARIEIIDYTTNTLDFYSKINECTLMICMRLHAAILAYAMCVKFLILPYHRKCYDFGRVVYCDQVDNYLLHEHDGVGVWGKKLDFMLNQDQSQLIRKRAGHLSKVSNHFKFI